VETIGAGRKQVWAAEHLAGCSSITNLRLADLDGDGTPEILSLWWTDRPRTAQLRVFHWVPQQETFAEIHSGDEATGHQMASIHGYDVRVAEGKHFVMLEPSQGSRSSSRLELRGGELFGTGGNVSNQGDSGIEGIVVISPVRPGPIRVGEARSESPYQTTLAVYDANDNHEIARTESGADGRFRIKLPPGLYVIGPPRDTQKRFPRAGEQSVTVKNNQFTHVKISFDSGMR
jgi:hypothetical protein